MVTNSTFVLTARFGLQTVCHRNISDSRKHDWGKRFFTVIARLASVS